MRNVRLLWNEVTKSFSQPLDWNRVVYALFDTNSQIYYIGKADDQNLRGRLLDPKKQELMRRARQRGAPHAGVICGVVMNDNVPDLSNWVSDIEALLISRENPWGNTAHPLISDDITVRCEGTWLGRESVYAYSNAFVRMFASPANSTPLTNLFGSLLGNPPKPRLLPGLNTEKPSDGFREALTKGTTLDLGWLSFLARMSENKPK